MEEQKKEMLKTLREKDRARRRTKKLQEEKKTSSETEDQRETAPGHPHKIEARGRKVIRNIDHQLWFASLILHYIHLITYTLY